MLRHILRAILGMILSCTAAGGGMENCRFALDYKPKFVASKAIPYLCDNPATVTEEPNYSPNYSDTPCSYYSVDHEPLGGGQVYLVIAQAGLEGVAGVSFGVAYGGSSGVGIDPAHVTWTPCANGLSFPSNDGVHGDFPQQGGGLRITWDISGGCPTNGQEVLGSSGLHVVVGVFYVYAYSSDVLRITPNNNISPGPELLIADCRGSQTDLYQIWGPSIVLSLVGQVGFNQCYGWIPCCCHEGSPPLPCFTTPVSATTWGKMKSKYKAER